MPDIYVVVALAFAVFAAVAAVGSAIVLAMGYERLRNGLERVKEGLDLIGRQTGFFSNELHRLEQRMETKKPSSKRSPAPSKRVSKKVKLPPSVSQDQPLVGQTGHGGSISIPMGMEPSNDWTVYQSLSRDEAMTRFSSVSSDTDGKIRFMS